jgi:ABC-2 type transport system ATP-binding protein
MKVRGLVQCGSGPGAPEILHEVTLDLHEGLTGLIGPNGAGKTTLLRTLAGILPPYEGHIEVGEVAMQDRPATVRRRVGYLPQFPGVYRRLTVREHLIRQHWWLYGEAPEEEDIRTALRHFGLAARENVRAVRLDPPERRWLALAMLWARRVPVMLLDEPTAGLDLEERLAFWDLMTTLLHQPDGPRAILVTTHLLDEVARFCRDAMLLVDGRMVYQGPVAGLAARAQGRTWYAVRGAVVPEAVDVGVDAARNRRLIVSVGEQRDGDEALAPRPPRLLDGYLVVERQWLDGRWADGRRAPRR